MVFAVSDLAPNPMYIFTNLQLNLLTQSFVSEDHLKRHSIRIFEAFLGCTNKLERDYAQEKIAEEASKADKIIIRGRLPTTLKIRHHIHEDGSMEEQPKRRRGPMRTYFDGSSIEHLGHAVAVCIDQSAGTITTQCPKGYDLNPKATALLGKVFPGYAWETVRYRQQQDQHSCAPLTLRNIFTFAGVMAPAETVDIMAWRAALTDRLEDYDRYAEANPATTTAAVVKCDNMLNFKIYGDNIPIYRRRYAAPMPQGL